MTSLILVFAISLVVKVQMLQVLPQNVLSIDLHVHVCSRDSVAGADLGNKKWWGCKYSSAQSVEKILVATPIFN